MRERRETAKPVWRRVRCASGPGVWPRATGHQQGGGAPVARLSAPRGARWDAVIPFLRQRVKPCFPVRSRTQDAGQQGDGEQVVGVGEEAPAEEEGGGSAGARVDPFVPPLPGCQNVCAPQRRTAPRRAPGLANTHMPATTMAWGESQRGGSAQ